MRDPNLNIKLSDFEKVLTRFGKTIMNNKITAKEASKRIFEASREYVARNRIFIPNLKASTRKKINRLLESDKKNVALFHSVLVGERTEAKHNVAVIKYINEGTVEYANLKEVTEMAEQFSEEFSYDTLVNGFSKFVKIGLEFMKRRYGLNRFKSLRDKIFERERILILINDESTKVAVATIAKYYFDKLEKETKFKYKGDVPYEQYVNFCYANEEANEIEATPAEWIDAQFEGMAYMDVVPEMYQVHGDGAKMRYMSFKYGRIKKGQKGVEDSIDTSKMSEAHRQYYEQVIKGN